MCAWLCSSLAITQLYNIHIHCIKQGIYNNVYLEAQPYCKYNLRPGKQIHSTFTKIAQGSPHHPRVICFSTLAEQPWRGHPETHARPISYPFPWRSALRSLPGPAAWAGESPPRSVRWFPAAQSVCNNKEPSNTLHSHILVWEQQAYTPTTVHALHVQVKVS